jgi:hypothetical protein
MIIQERVPSLYIVVGTPIYHPEVASGDEEQVIIDMLDEMSNTVYEFNRGKSPFTLQTFGLSCIVDVLFDIKGKAQGVADELTELSGGDIHFVVSEISKQTNAINEKHVREVGYSVSFEGAIPSSGTIGLFLTDPQYIEIASEGTITYDGDMLYTAYAVNEEVAEQNVSAHIEELFGVDGT